MKKPERNMGKVVLWSLIIFFVVFASVDAFFIYKAVNTHVGVVTENPYDKGLAYNETLKNARLQKEMDIADDVDFSDDGMLRWHLLDENEMPIENAQVTAEIFRPINSEHIIQTTLLHKGNGVYQAAPEIPLKGIWTVKLEAKWNSKQYKKTTNIIKK